MNDESPAVGEVEEARWATRISDSGSRFLVAPDGSRWDLRSDADWSELCDLLNAAVSDPDADTTVRYELHCAHGPYVYERASAEEVVALAAKRNANNISNFGNECKPYVPVKVTTTTTREVLS